MKIENQKLTTGVGTDIYLDGQSVQLSYTISQGHKVFKVTDCSGRDIGEMLSKQENLALALMMSRMWHEYKDYLMGKELPQQDEDDQEANFVFKGTVVNETEKAYLVETIDNAFWLPKSKSKMAKLEDNFYEITIPEWLAAKKELM